MPRHDRESQQPSFDQLKQDLSDLTDTVEQFVSSSAHEGNEQLQQLRQDANELLHHVKNRVSHYGENMKHRLQEHGHALHQQGKAAFDRADNYVQENPWQGIGLAALVGVIAGLIIGKR